MIGFAINGMMFLVWMTLAIVFGTWAFIPAMLISGFFAIFSLVMDL